MSSIGLISLNREVMEHWISDNDKHFKWWVFVLMNVNHEERKISIGSKIHTIKPGQSGKSLRTWSNILDTTAKTVSKFFDLLESDKMITRKTIGKGKQSTTLITVNNWSKFQTTGKHKIPQKNEDKKEKKKTESGTNEKFLNLFNEMKSKSRDRKCETRSLSQTAKNNLKKLTEENYNEEDWKKVISVMLAEDWPLKSGNDSPEHTLRNTNFLRYLNMYETNQNNLDNEIDKPNKYQKLLAGKGEKGVS